jgi:UDP-N-acetylmuramate--alanine ligase
MRVHIVGVGGVGMSGVASLAWQAGHHVTGSDIKHVSADTIGVPGDRLTIFHGHSASHLADTDVVVASSSIKADNCEVREAKRLGLPIWSRLEAVNNLLASKRSLIAVAGSFGKSSTTAMLSHILSFSGFDPTIYLGAPIPGRVGNAVLTDGPLAVVEACEYKDEFLRLDPTHVLVTNIAVNHEDYFGSGLDHVARSFERFANPTGGRKRKIFFCRHDAGTRLSRICDLPGAVSYGTRDADCTAEIAEVSDTGIWEYRVSIKGRHFATVRTRWAGEHTARNLAGVAALCFDLGIRGVSIERAMYDCPLLERRFAVTSWSGGHFVEDNARQPEQLAATLATVRRWQPNAPLVVAIGHWGMLNRRDLARYVEALVLADIVLIPPSASFEVQSGGPEPLGADFAFASALRQAGKVVFVGPLSEFEPSSFSSGAKPIVFALIGFESFVGDFRQLKQKALKNG